MHEIGFSVNTNEVFHTCTLWIPIFFKVQELLLLETCSNRQQMASKDDPMNISQQ